MRCANIILTKEIIVMGEYNESQISIISCERTKEAKLYYWSLFEVRGIKGCIEGCKKDLQEGGYYFLIHIGWYDLENVVGTIKEQSGYLLNAQKAFNKMSK